MKIKIIAPPVIDVSGLMRSPQYDLACLYSALKTHFYDVLFHDFRFFFYDDFYLQKRQKIEFVPEDFREHKKILDIILSGSVDTYYQMKIDGLFYNFLPYCKDQDVVVIPFTIYQQFTIEYALGALYLAFLIHKKFPHIRILAFGNYSEKYARDIIDNFNFIEFTCLRGDETAFVKYLQAGFPVQQIFENIIYQGMDVSKIIEKEPLAEREYLADYSSFDREPYTKNGTPLVLGYQLGTGCKNTCFYCYNSHKGGITYTKNIERIISDLILLKQKNNTSFFHFCDDEINYDNTFLRLFAEKMIEKKVGIFWTALIIPKDLSFDLLLILFQAGCRQLRFGIESGSQRILDIIGKGTKITEISQIIQNAKSVGISCYASFIVDIPQETTEDMNLTLQFIYKNAAYLDNVVVCAYRAHLGNYDQRYFQYLLGKGDYNFFRGMRYSSKKIFLRNFCDKLGKKDIDIIDFMKRWAEVFNCYEVNKFEE